MGREANQKKLEKERGPTMITLVLIVTSLVKWIAIIIIGIVVFLVTMYISAWVGTLAVLSAFEYHTKNTELFVFERSHSHGNTKET